MGALFKVYKSDGITEIANIKSVVFREAVNTGEYLTPGCVSSAEIEVEVFNTQPNAVAAGDVVYAYVYDANNNGTLLGKFNCEPKIDTKNSYKFTAYDNALKLNADFSQWLQANQSNFPYTIKQLVQQACTIAGVTLGSSSWPLSTQSVQAFYADGLTCRDILSYAAELAGRFVRCHTDGNIYFDWFAANANSIAPSTGTGVYAYKQDGLTYANYTTTALARVAVHPSGEDDVAYIYPTGVTSGNTLHIKNNLLLTGADASFYNAAAQQVYTAVTAVGSYCPMSVNLFPRENPFRAGDIVSITDAQSVTISAPITEMTISNAAATLVSEGRENYEDATETAKAITQLASDVVRINKLKVDWAGINTAIINYLTANDVTAQNLTIVDANNNVLATFNANGITLGQTDEAHAELDFNSFILKDKDGNVYFSVGDERDANGEVTVTINYSGDGSTKRFSLFPTTTSAYYSTMSVQVEGATVSNYTTADNRITFTTAPNDGDSIVITYTTDKALYHYDIGSRLNGSDIGTYSIASGYDSEASAPYASVLGGFRNKATKNCSVACGGGENEANGTWSSVVGGNTNKANGNDSAIVGGGASTADGNDSFIGGGNSATAQAHYSAICGGVANIIYKQSKKSAIIGGENNVASLGERAVIIGGKYNRVEGENSVAIGLGTYAKRRSSFTLGEYNVIDSAGSDSTVRGDYVEIVGNGADANNRSNARTLDWSGNETLAGGLTTGGNVSVGGDLSVTGSVSLGSALPVASGGTGASNVTDALQNLRAFSLYVGEKIPVNSDMDDYTTPGTYYCSSNSDAATLSNLPPNFARAFKLVVYAKNNSTNVNQELHPNNSALCYIRSKATTWDSWKRVLDTDDLPLSIDNGGTGATDAASALAALGGTPLVSVDNTANTSYTFSVANGSRFVLSTIASNADGKGLYIFNTTTTGNITRADVLAAGSVSFSTATGKLTVTSTRPGTFAFLVFKGSVSLDT